MIKYLAIGLWGCSVTAGAALAAQHFAEAKPKAASVRPDAVVKEYKTKEINVPRIVDGKIAGYAVAQFVYDVDSSKQTASSLSPDAFIVDAAYRYLYDDPSIDFKNMKPLSLKRLTDTIRDEVDRRLGAKVVTDVTIQELTFLSANQTDKPI